MQSRMGRLAGRNLAVCHKLVLSLKFVFLEGGSDFLAATKTIHGGDAKSLTHTHTHLVLVLGFLDFYSC